MNMPYTILSHTADARMEVKGKTLEELFRDALRGMMSIVGGGGEAAPVAASVSRTVGVEAPDVTVLLVDFLNAALAESQIRREIYADAAFKKFSERALVAELNGFPVAEFSEDVKAVTYHEANVHRGGSGEWETLLVLDI